MWYDKQNPLVTFVDIRIEVRPHIVADSRFLPLASNEYDMVTFDPPHVNTGKPGKGPQAEAFQKYYGYFTTEQIRDTIRGTAVEAHRVTKPYALMALKWNDHDQKLEKIIGLMEKHWEPLFGQKITTRTKHVSGTYWVLLIRK